MLKSIKVRDYMTRNLVTFRPDMNLFTAINRMLEHRISGAPVRRWLMGRATWWGCCRRVIVCAAFFPVLITSRLAVMSALT